VDRFAPYHGAGMDLAAHFRIILQNWWRILLVALALAGLVFGVSFTKSDVYQAAELLQVNIGRLTTGGQTLQQDVVFFAQTYAQLGQTPSVVRKAVAGSGLKISASQGLSRVSAAEEGQLGFIRIKATGTTPRRAEQLARAVGQTTISTVADQQQQATFNDIAPLQLQRNELQQQIAAAPPGSQEQQTLQSELDSVKQAEADRRHQPTNSLFVIADARASKTPISPKPMRDALLAFLVALVVAAELSVAIHAVGDRFSGTDDSSEILRLTGLPLLAKIPRGSGTEVLEAFRVLRTNLMFLEGAGKPRTLAVVSANTGAGKTFTALHLAQSAAALDEKVVLVDGDLRKPAIHDRLHVARAPGLSAVLQGGDIASALRKTTESPFLRVLPSGAPVQDPSGVLGARAFRHVLDALRAVRLVVVDTPPGALFADAMAIASQCDATIFVIDLKSSRRQAVRGTLDSLERAGANLVGVVVNRTATVRRAAYYGT
jgi:polysaccharide biosynthesis transport protein